MFHFTSINDIDNDQLMNLFNLADAICKGQADRWGSNHANGRILANLFYEPSTRTSSSFFSAMTRLGGSCLQINEVNYSSVSKGENLKDTIKTIGCYADAIVLRSKNIGDAELAKSVSAVPIINAGDGAGEHPTQTLLDLYTIWKNHKTLEGLTVTFVGDIENGRTVHSLDKALSNCTKHFCDTYDKSIWPKSDVYYLTRVQRERGSEGTYSMRKEHLHHIPNHAIVMHPFPRNEEIPEWFDNDPRAKYFEQMQNGLFVRMALLYKILGGI